MHLVLDLIYYDNSVVSSVRSSGHGAVVKESVSQTLQELHASVVFGPFFHILSELLVTSARLVPRRLVWEHPVVEQ